VRVGHLWAENPWTLIRFGVRLLGAWQCLLVELSPRQLRHTLWQFISQTSRTFFRGVFVILPMGAALGFGIGAVARAAGPALQPVFASVILIAILRDAVPLILMLFVAGRMGGSIAARLGSEDGPVSASVLTNLALPHHVAATITSAVFYILAAYFIVNGYLSLGDPSRFVDTSPGWYFGLASTRSALWFGLGKSVLFGVLVAYVASAYGILARERGARGRERTDDVQNAVWETTATSTLLATAISVVFWLAFEGPLS
jgi:ABC-type transporter Mla maintaining outer membrane lipid asymmetry permease subunit MlaE